MSIVETVTDVDNTFLSRRELTCNFAGLGGRLRKLEAADMITKEFGLGGKVVIPMRLKTHVGKPLVTGTFYVYDDESLAKRHINPTIMARLEKARAKVAEAKEAEAKEAEAKEAEAKEAEAKEAEAKEAEAKEAEAKEAEAKEAEAKEAEAKEAEAKEAEAKEAEAKEAEAKEAADTAAAGDDTPGESGGAAKQDEADKEAKPE